MQCIGNVDCCHGSRCAGLILWDIHAEICGEGLRDRMFETEFFAILRRALDDKEAYVRSSAIAIFTAAIAQSAITSVLRGVHTQIFADGFRDKIFDTEIVTALVHTLHDEYLDVRWSAVKLFTAAIAQGALNSVCRILILKYLQTAFGTRYLMPRLSPHLEVHWVIKIPT